MLLKMIQMKNRIQKQIQKIIQFLKDDTAYMLLSVSIGLGFLIGILAERQNTEKTIFKMQLECFKRKVGDFYYTNDNKTGMEFRWKTN